MSQHVPSRAAVRTTLAALAAVAVLSILASSCGGDAGEGGADERQITAIGVTLTVASPWVAQRTDRGLVAGPSEEALDSPVGPRLRVDRGNTVLQDPSALVPGLGSAPRIEVVAGPDTVSFGSEEGVFVQFLEEDGRGDVMKWFAVVNVDGISVYQFIVETPESEWDAQSPQLIAIATNAIFEASTAGANDDEDTSRPQNSLGSYLTEFARITEATASEISDVVEEKLQGDLAGVETVEDVLELMDEVIDRFLELVTQARDDIEALDPPADVSDIHRELVAVFDVAVAGLGGFQDDLAQIDPNADPQEVLTQIESLAEDLIDQFATLDTQGDLICFRTQAIADDNNLDVNLNCGD